MARNLPDEILYTIFKGMPFNDLRNYQQVCRSWYSPAHCMLLKDNSITSTKIEQFINSIDSNPKETFLKLIKSISITATIRSVSNTDLKQEPEPYRLTQQVALKLNCRFSNLESVKIYDDTVIYDDFNYDICKTILTRCPRLKEFEVSIDRDDRDYYMDISNRLRLLLTRVTVPIHAILSSRSQDVVEFLTSFPRLSIIESVHHHLDNLGKLLPVMMQLSKVETIGFRQRASDEDDFAEKYLTTIRNNMENNYWKISLMLRGCNWFTKTPPIPHNQNLTAAQRDTFCNDIISLACSVTDTARVALRNVRFTGITQIIPLVTPKFFHSTNRNNILEISVTNINLSNLDVESYKYSSTRSIKMRLPSQLNFDEIATSIFNPTAPIINVNQFIFGVNIIVGEYTLSMDVFDIMLGKMPSLKKVILNVPSSCAFIRKEHTRTYPLVEELTIQANLDDQWQVLLDGFGVKFPNLKCLRLLYFRGFCEKLWKFQIDLTNYTLESFTSDIRAIESMWHKHYNPYIFKEVVFIAVQVDQKLYKISPGQPPICTHIDEIDLEGFTLGRHYVQVDIIVGVLKRFEVSYGATDLFSQKTPLAIVYESTS